MKNKEKQPGMDPRTHEERAVPTAGENPKRAIKANKHVSNNRVSLSRDGSGEQVMQPSEKNEDSATQEGEEITTMRSSSQQAVFVQNIQLMVKR